MSPVNWRPDSPLMPISSPASFSKDLYERLGTYRTLGWAEATWPLNEDRIDEKAFMDDLFRAFDDRAQVILNGSTRRSSDLLIGVIESTDRVQHMMWRFIDPHASDVRRGARREVRRRDRARLPAVRRASSARSLKRVDPGTLVCRAPTTGSIRSGTAVNLNTWLVQNGFIALQGRSGRATRS